MTGQISSCYCLPSLIFRVGVEDVKSNMPIPSKCRYIINFLNYTVNTSNRTSLTCTCCEIPSPSTSLVSIDGRHVGCTSFHVKSSYRVESSYMDCQHWHFEAGFNWWKDLNMKIEPKNWVEGVVCIPDLKYLPPLPSLSTLLSLTNWRHTLSPNLNNFPSFRTNIETYLGYKNMICHFQMFVYKVLICCCSFEKIKINLLIKR